MLADAATMSVNRARAVLQDVSRLSPEEIDAAQRIVWQFQAARPRNAQCVACGCCNWSEHTTKSGDATWACNNCHRSSALTEAEWAAKQAPVRAQESRKSAALKKIADEE